MKIKEMLISIAEVYDKELSDMALTIYETTLAKYSEKDIKQALNKLVRTSKFFPKPAEIVETIEGDEFTKAEKAWHMVEIAMDKFDISGSFRFPDGKINTAIRILGGWRKICMANLEDLKYIKNEFLKIYPHVVDKGYHCIGEIEFENKYNGYSEMYQVLDWNGHPIKMVDNKNENKVDKLVDDLVDKVGKIPQE